MWILIWTEENEEFAKVEDHISYHVASNRFAELTNTHGVISVEAFEVVKVMEAYRTSPRKEAPYVLHEKWESTPTNKRSREGDTEKSATRRSKLAEVRSITHGHSLQNQGKERDRRSR